MPDSKSSAGSRIHSTVLGSMLSPNEVWPLIYTPMPRPAIRSSSDCDIPVRSDILVEKIPYITKTNTVKTTNRKLISVSLTLTEHSVPVQM